MSLVSHQSDLDFKWTLGSQDWKDPQTCCYCLCAGGRSEPSSCCAQLQKGDYCAQLTWRKERAKTHHKGWACLPFPFHLGKQCRVVQRNQLTALRRRAIRWWEWPTFVEALKELWLIMAKRSITFSWKRHKWSQFALNLRLPKFQEDVTEHLGARSHLVSCTTKSSITSSWNFRNAKFRQNWYHLWRFQEDVMGRLRIISHNSFRAIGFHKSRSPSSPYGPAPQGSQLLTLE